MAEGTIIATSSTNLRQFTNAVKTEIELQGLKQFGLFKRTIAKKAMRALVDRTPVDTGRMKGNWNIGENIVPTDFDEDLFDTDGTATKEGLSIFIDSSSAIFDDLFIVNNTPYLEFIHDGTAHISANPFVEGVAAELGLEVIIL